MASVDEVFAAAEAFLDAAVSALAQTTVGPPPRSYVSPGQPPIDCEQIVSWAQLLGEVPFNVGEGAQARARAINRGGRAQVTIFVQVVRCVPLPQEKNGRLVLPEPAALQAAAQTIDKDGWALWLGMNYELKHGTLKEECSGAERLGGDKLVPSGGYGGWTFSWRLPLNGGVLGT